MKLKEKKYDYRIKKQDIGKSFVVYIGHPVFVTENLVGKKMNEVWKGR